MLQTGTRIDELPLWCGVTETGGIDEVPEWQDWTEQETTPDQLRIEDVLEGSPICGARLLHVGVGNSGLALRFHDTMAQIDGITVQQQEHRHASQLGLARYRPLLASKYSENIACLLSRRYDFIVDNNPTTFCCCRQHLSTMLSSYTALLRPGGVILSDVVGLDWTTQPNDPRWKLTAEEWFALGRFFGLKDVRYTDYVVGLKS